MSGGNESLALVIFDCDGVLVDSEPVANRVVAASLTELGWPMTPAESQQRFLGQALPDMRSMVASRLGEGLAARWAAEVAERVAEAMLTEAEAVPGAHAAVAAVEARGLPWRVASNSSHAELAAKLGRIGLDAAGRVHSFEDVPRGKPAPDLFLAAAAAEGVAPGACLVVEDSLVGIAGARAAGMRVVALVRHGEDGGHRQAGARVIRDLEELPTMIEAAADRNWR
jgi:HAD superfamily hydrolase (TIGR01509 family)